MITFEPLFAFLAVTILSVSLIMFFASGLLYVLNKQMGYFYQKYWAMAWFMMAAYTFFGGITMILRIQEVYDHWALFICTVMSQIFGYLGPLLLLAGYFTMKNQRKLHSYWWGILILIVFFSYFISTSFNLPEEWRERYITRVGLRSLFCCIVCSWVAIKTILYFKNDNKSGPKIFAYAMLTYGLSWSVYVIASVDMIFGGLFYRYLAIFGVIEFACQVVLIYGFTIWAIQNEKEKVANAQEKLENMAWLDSLTGLYNRRWLDCHAEQWLKTHKIAISHVAVMFIDLDGFKQINDRFGHKVGDQLLQKVATTLEKHANEKDIICRLGGDEFIYIYTESYSKDDSESKATRIRNSIRDIRNIGAYSIKFSCSIGISCPQHVFNIEALTTASDKAMYVAKHNGKNTIQFAKLDAIDVQESTESWAT